MGVVDNMVHTESSKVVSLSNGSHSEGRLGRMPIENGHCAAHVSPPKHKRRRVSAIRDFPPGCGWFATQIDLKPGKEATRTGTIENSVNGDRSDDVIGIDCVKPSGAGVVSPSQEVAQSSVSREMLQQQNDFDFKLEKPIIASDQVDGLELMKAESAGVPLQELKPGGTFDAPNTSYQVYGPELMKAESVEMPLQELNPGEIHDAPKNLHQVYGLELMKAESSGMPLPDLEPGKIFEPSQKPIFEPSQKLIFEPTQKPFPELEPGEHFDVSQDAHQLDGFELIKAESPGMPLPELEFVEIFDVSKQSHQVNGAASMEDIASQSELKSWSPPGLPIVPLSSGLDKSSTRNYPPRRRVSAVRDFPPCVGTNSLPLSREECTGVVASAKKRSLEREKSGNVDMTIMADVKRMRQDFRDGDDHKNKVEGDIATRTGDEIHPESEGVAAKERRNHGELRTPYGKEMKVAQEDAKEKSMKSLCGNDKYGFDDNTETVTKTGNKNVRNLEENLVKDIVVYTEGKSVGRNFSDLSRLENQLQEEDSSGLENVSNRILVQGLMAAPSCPWRQGKKVDKPNMAGSTGKRKVKKHDLILIPRPRPAQRTNNSEGEISGGKCTNKNSSPSRKAYQGMDQLQLVTWDEEGSLEHVGESKIFHVGSRSCNFEVSLPPSRPSSSAVKGDDSDVISSRNKVRETLRLFQLVSRKLLQEEEAKPQERSSAYRRIDYQAARILKDKGKYVNTGKQIIGSVPGVEVGDEFHYRVELNMIGLHRQIQGGIDYVKEGGKILATSIVASGGYDDEVDNSDVLIYTGQGGNVMNGDKEPEDQKLERGNLALANSKHTKNPVRVIRGETKASDSSDAKARTYIYDGLYLVEDLWQEPGPHGKLVFRFRLLRIPDQPELALKVVKKSRKSEVREGLCVNDISQGKELFPICAVNIIDDEKPPQFAYITDMKYPGWYHPLPPKGCDCTSRCSEYGKCSCVLKNGGEIPYNHNGAIVQAKPLVYECGPSCKCPPSCYNRVSQHGIKFQLEIFKTESRGWGVRSLNSIPSGSFICEYVGELLEEKEADERTGNDEYLFDIGHNFDASFWDELSTIMPEAQSTSCQVVEDGGFTIDAAEYGNVGRFINHSCSPNLYAQNVLYDYEDKRIPHIMLFAMENIPPLQELTYHYNYSIDQVRDSNGNIKKKSCYCGSSECTGRMY